MKSNEILTAEGFWEMLQDNKNDWNVITKIANHFGWQTSTGEIEGAVYIPNDYWLTEEYKEDLKDSINGLGHICDMLDRQDLDRALGQIPRGRQVINDIVPIIKKLKKVIDWDNNNWGETGW